MSVFQAVVLGIVQGLSEFIPISSSAHLVLVPSALGWESPSLEFDVLLHTASLVAVLAYFRAEVMRIIVDTFRSGPGRRLAVRLAIATIPAAVAGLLFEGVVEGTLDRPRVVSLLLLGTAVMLTLSELSSRDDADRNPEVVADLSRRVGSWRALVIGSAQAAALLPGFSRSGFTIGAGLLSGLDRAQAARFSFLLSMPALAGAAVLELPQLSSTAIDPGPLVAGFIASLLSSYVAVAAMIGYVQRRGLYPFAVYCLLVGIVGAFFFPA